MERSQWLAIFTGAVAILLGVGYLILVQFLDMRGEMIPAPVGTIIGGLWLNKIFA